MAIALVTTVLSPALASGRSDDVALTAAQIAALVTIAGLFLGILGSLFLAYDFLGRPHGVLRTVLRVGIPTLVSALAVGTVGGIVSLVLFPGPLKVVVSETLFLAILGALIGTYNGLFINPADPRKRRSIFSLRDAAVGLLTTGVYAGLALWDLEWGLNDASNGGAPFDARFLVAPLVVVGVIAAGVWRVANQGRTGAGVMTEMSARRPIHPFSLRGYLLGFIGTFAVFFSWVLLVTLVLTVAYPDVTTQWGQAALVAVGVGVGGGLTGALSRSIFWWANALPEHVLGAIGLMLTFSGFVIQLAQPIASLLK